MRFLLFSVGLDGMGRSTSGGAAQAEIEEPSWVQSDGSGVELVPVLVVPPYLSLRWPIGHEVGEDPFHRWSSAVVEGDGFGLFPLLSGLGEQPMVGVDL